LFKKLQMGYNIQLCRKEVMQEHKSMADGYIFENEKNLLPFTEVQKNYLKNRLLKYGYFIKKEGKKGVQLGHKEGKMTCLLTNHVLHFSSTFSELFEISMTASEFTDTDEFAKYDPQSGGWENNSF
jgi:hypothetical protein